MLKFREIRPWAKTIFGLELIAAFAVLAAGMASIPFTMGWYGTPGLLMSLALSALASVITFGFLTWIGRDARRSYAQIHEQHKQEKARPGGDLTDVVSAPDLPPWTGTGR